MVIGRSQVGQWLDRPIDDIIVSGITFRPDETLDRVAWLMREEKLTAVPITTPDDLLMSMVTVTDLLRVLVADAVIHA
jgi:CBS domain-containing protein